MADRSMALHRLVAGRSPRVLSKVQAAGSTRLPLVASAASISLKTQIHCNFGRVGCWCSSVVHQRRAPPAGATVQQ